MKALHPQPLLGPNSQLRIGFSIIKISMGTKHKEEKRERKDKRDKKKEKKKEKVRSDEKKKALKEKGKEKEKEKKKRKEEKREDKKRKASSEQELQNKTDKIKPTKKTEKEKSISVGSLDNSQQAKFLRLMGAGKSKTKVTVTNDTGSFKNHREDLEKQFSQGIDMKNRGGRVGLGA